MNNFIQTLDSTQLSIFNKCPKNVKIELVKNNIPAKLVNYIPEYAKYLRKFSLMDGLKLLDYLKSKNIKYVYKNLNDLTLEEIIYYSKTKPEALTTDINSREFAEQLSHLPTEAIDLLRSLGTNSLIVFPISELRKELMSASYKQDLLKLLEKSCTYIIDNSEQLNLFITKLVSGCDSGHITNKIAKHLDSLSNLTPDDILNLSSATKYYNTVETAILALHNYYTNNSTSITSKEQLVTIINNYNKDEMSSTKCCNTSYASEPMPMPMPMPMSAPIRLVSQPIQTRRKLTPSTSNSNLIEILQRLRTLKVYRRLILTLLPTMTYYKALFYVLRLKNIRISDVDTVKRLEDRNQLTSFLPATEYLKLPCLTKSLDIHNTLSANQMLRLSTDFLQGKLKYDYSFLTTFMKYCSNNIKYLNTYIELFKNTPDLNAILNIINYKNDTETDDEIFSYKLQNLHPYLLKYNIDLHSENLSSDKPFHSLIASLVSTIIPSGFNKDELFKYLTTSIPYPDYYYTYTNNLIDNQLSKVSLTYHSEKQFLEDFIQRVYLSRKYPDANTNTLFNTAYSIYSLKLLCQRDAHAASRYRHTFYAYFGDYDFNGNYNRIARSVALKALNQCRFGKGTRRSTYEDLIEGSYPHNDKTHLLKHYLRLRMLDILARHSGYYLMPPSIKTIIIDITSDTSTGTDLLILSRLEQIVTSPESLEKLVYMVNLGQKDMLKRYLMNFSDCKVSEKYMIEFDLFNLYLSTINNY